MKVNALILLLAATVLGSHSGNATPLQQLLRTQLTQQLEQQEVDRPTGRIIDGEMAGEQSAPYIVSLSASRVTYAHVCAGTIIDKFWILTAAHCLDEIRNVSGSVTGGYVYAGLADRTAIDTAERRSIAFAHMHRGYNGIVGSDDIALIRVDAPFQFGARIQLAILPYWHENNAGETAATYGWGIVETESIKYAKELRVSRSQILPPGDCASALPKNVAISRNQVCAASDACYGDGGGPLVIERAGSNFAEIVGITSWGYLPCGYNKRPIVYTAVAEYVDYILEVQWAYNTIFG